MRSGPLAPWQLKGTAMLAFFTGESWLFRILIVVAIGALILGLPAFYRSPGERAMHQMAKLSPPQEHLLGMIAEYQGRFAANKLIILRENGRLHFDDDPKRGEDVDLIIDLYGAFGPTEQKQFEELIESMPPKYLQVLPETRLDGPFVVRITEAGTKYMRETRSSRLK
jgi:hypothetical protein